MRWKDVNLNPEVRVLRQFGGLCSIACGGMAVWQIIGSHNPGRAAAWGAGSILCAVLALIRPNWLRAPFVASIVATFPIGWVVSNLVLFLLYFGLMTPLAVAFRWSGRDLLNLKPPTESEWTFWSSKNIDRDKRSYFRQF